MSRVRDHQPQETRTLVRIEFLNPVRHGRVNVGVALGIDARHLEFAVSRGLISGEQLVQAIGEGLQGIGDNCLIQEAIEPNLNDAIEALQDPQSGLG